MSLRGGAEVEHDYNNLDIDALADETPEDPNDSGKWPDVQEEGDKTPPIIIDGDQQMFEQRHGSPQPEVGQEDSDVAFEENTSRSAMFHKSKFGPSNIRGYQDFRDDEIFLHEEGVQHVLSEMLEDGLVTQELASRIIAKVRARERSCLDEPLEQGNTSMANIGVDSVGPRIPRDLVLEHVLAGQDLEPEPAPAPAPEAAGVDESRGAKEEKSDDSRPWPREDNPQRELGDVEEEEAVAEPEPDQTGFALRPPIPVGHRVGVRLGGDYDEAGETFGTVASYDPFTESYVISRHEDNITACASDVRELRRGKLLKGASQAEGGPAMHNIDVVDSKLARLCDYLGLDGANKGKDLDPSKLDDLSLDPFEAMETRRAARVLQKLDGNMGDDGQDVTDNFEADPDLHPTPGQAVFAQSY